MNHVVEAAVVAALVGLGLSAPRPAAAYSVLAHEANIDALWDSTIASMLRTRFPAASLEQILEARGYAYGTAYFFARRGRNSLNRSTAIFERRLMPACLSPSRVPRGAGYQVAADTT